MHATSIVSYINVASRGPCLLRRRDDEERMEVVACCDLQTGNRKPYALTSFRWPPRHQTVSFDHLWMGGAWATVSDPSPSRVGRRGQQLAFECSTSTLPSTGIACLFVFAFLPETLTTASIYLVWRPLWRPCSDEPRYVMCECELASSRFPAPLLVCRIA